MQIPDILNKAQEWIAGQYFARADMLSLVLDRSVALAMTGVGIEFSNGPESNLGVTIYLAEPIAGLSGTIGVSVPGIGHLDIGLRVTGRFRPAAGIGSFRSHQRPAQAGFSIGPRRFEDVSGTLGALVCFDDDPNSWFVLSCNHVLALNTFDAAANREILQPSVGNDLAGAGDNAIALLDKLHESCRLQAGPPATNIGDFALARVMDKSKVSAQMVAEMPAIAEKKPLSLQDFQANHSNSTLVKVGAATGLTEGVLKAPKLDFTADYASPMSIHCAFTEELLVVSSQAGKPFAKDGDSGSLVLTKEGNPVGLVFALDDFHETVVCPLDQLFSTLGLSFVTP